MPTNDGVIEWIFSDVQTRAACSKAWPWDTAGTSRVTATATTAMADITKCTAPCPTTSKAATTPARQVRREPASRMVDRTLRDA
eukprot:800043-Prorocentrum_minimum.AAC.2